MSLVARAEREAQAAIDRRSPLWFAAFAALFTRAVGKDFHALRLARGGPSPESSTPHLVIYTNHPSWWDPAVIVVLIARLFPGRAGYAPIDGAMIGKYGFMARIGAFGVAQDSLRGAAAFLQTASLALTPPGNFLVVTAQGRFVDTRERPVRLAPGLAHLAERVPAATFVPLALEYPFWEERKPEALARFGPPVTAGELAGLGRAERAAALAARLQATMDELAAEAMARDPTRFTTLVSGRAGVGGVYDLWRRGRAALRGEAFVAAHGGQP